LPNSFGSLNTCVGYGTIASDVFNSTAIGANASCTVSDKIRLGNIDITVVEGQVAYSFPSDGRFKFNVMDNVPGLVFIEKLKPVTYQFDLLKYNNHIRDKENAFRTQSDSDYHDKLKRGSETIHTGFIAQEVEAAAKEIGYDFHGVVIPQNEKDNYGLRYAEFVVPLVKAVQELNS
jgi:hypothetical protein